MSSKAATGTRKAKAALRGEVIAAAVAQIERAGPTRYRASVVADFADRGVNRATLYRWLDAAGTSGELGHAVSKAFRTRTQGKGVEAGTDSADGAIAAADHALATMPSLTRFEDLVGGGTIDITTTLRECILAARSVMEFARDVNGRVKMPKLLVMGSEHLRRSLETGQRIVEKVHEIQRVQEFHKLIIEEIRKESPECAMRILERMDAQTRSWGAV